MPEFREMPSAGFNEMLCNVHVIREDAMPIIDWNITLLVGIPEVDKHHQQLVQVLNEAYDAFREEVEVSAAVIDEIMASSARDFAFEEELMAKVSYPNIAKHKNEHLIFCRRVEELQSNLKQNKKISIELIWFLCNWVSHHIRETDAEFGRFMDGARLRKKG